MRAGAALTAVNRAAAAGLFVALYPISGALALAVVIAILLIADGVLRTVYGAIVRPAIGWGWLLAAGICSVFVGVILLLIGWPATAFWVTGLLLGVNLIVTGTMNTVVAVASRVSAPRLVPRGA